MYLRHSATFIFQKKIDQANILSFITSGFEPTSSNIRNFIFIFQLIFCDDVYNLLYYEADTSPKRLLAYDDRSDQNYDGGRVVSNGTFSKILAPGSRVGWMEAGPRVRDQVHDCGVLSSGGSLNNVMSGFISSAIQIGGQAEHVKHLRQLYRARVPFNKFNLFDC